MRSNKKILQKPGNRHRCALLKTPGYPAFSVRTPPGGHCTFAHRFWFFTMLSPSPTAPVSVALLGSTGSIGTQTLAVVRAHPGRFRVAVLSAQRQWEVLVQQARGVPPRRRRHRRRGPVPASEGGPRPAARNGRARWPRRPLRSGGPPRRGRGAHRPRGLRRPAAHRCGHPRRQNHCPRQQGDPRGGRRTHHAARGPAQHPPPPRRFRAFGHLPVPRGRGAQPGRENHPHRLRWPLPGPQRPTDERRNQGPGPPAPPTGRWGPKSPSTPLR